MLQMYCAGLIVDLGVRSSDATDVHSADLIVDLGVRSSDATDVHSADLIVDLGVRGSDATDVQRWSDCRFRCKGFCSYRYTVLV
jgi:hypothetical protein